MSISLTFPKDSYKLLSYCYQGKKIEYRLYEDICYVQKPVDVKYQTMNVKVPVSIDGKKIDATNAPIFFGIGCAGCLSSTAASGGSFAAPGGGPGSPGGPGVPGGPGGMMPPLMPSDIKDSQQWEAMAGGEGHAGLGITGIPLLGSFKGGMPGPGPGGEPGEPAPPDGSRWGKLALGFVIVEVGCRGRENVFPDGKFYGKAPAAVVDLKAAIRYMRHNRDVFPGDVEKIITTGGSGGGLQSTLVASSGNCQWFEPYLEALGAAKERDDVFISYSTSPIIDHENVDGAIEWQGGSLLTNDRDIEVSKGCVQDFANYLESSEFFARGTSDKLTIDNLGQYIVDNYLAPDATLFLRNKSEGERAKYLEEHPWISWDGAKTSFAFEDFGKYAPRNASVPSFDDLALSQPCTNLYGDEATDSRNFTDRSIALASGDPDAKAPQWLKDIVHSQNPTWHILQKHSDVAPHWWIRHGACDSCTAVAPAVLLATALENAGKDVDLRLVWDGGHCEDNDHDAFLAWVQDVTDYHV